MCNVQRQVGGAHTSSVLRKQGGSADGTYVMLGIHCSARRNEAAAGRGVSGAPVLLKQDDSLAPPFWSACVTYPLRDEHVERADVDENSRL